MSDFHNFNTLIHERYPELTGYWLEVFEDMVKLRQDYEDKCTELTEIVRLNDILLNILKQYNLEHGGFYEHSKETKH